MNDSLLDIPCTTISGDQTTLGQFGARAVLVVNTASKCGFTPQYQGLEALWKEFSNQGLVVAGFPCNQFGHQEPGDEAQIGQFCEFNFGVSFPLFAKVEVNGDQAHPLFVRLKARAPGLLGSKAIKWNFTKFLIAGDGSVVKRFSPTTKPEALREEVQRWLGA